MTKHRAIFLAGLAVIATGVVVGSLVHLWAQDKPKPVDKDPDKAQPESAEMAAVRKTADAFTKAFNAGDAKAVAAFFTKEAEYFGPGGEVIRGSDEIEKSYVALFKEQPKATLEIDIESVRMIGRFTALEEGTLTVKVPGDEEPGVTQYSVLHVKEDDGWKMASIREVVPDPQHLVTTKNLEWMIGEWVAKGELGEARVTYAWDEDKVFLRGRYTLKKGDKVLSSGTQIIGKNPGGGLRSWMFDSSGTFGESVWSRDGSRWISETVGTLPDGSETTGVNIMVPLGKDAFTWQTVERTVAGSPLPDSPPVKATRVK